MREKGKIKPGRWRKLDNAAQAFPAATGKKDSRVFRFYCVLREEIHEENLQKALDKTLGKYPLFRTVLRKGLFWFYMEPRAIMKKTVFRSIIRERKAEVKNPAGLSRSEEPSWSNQRWRLPS